jgi:secreted PhoX family phosphatase
MAFDGPAAGSDRLKTSAEPNGRTTKGTYGNCAGGITPWGTVLTAEENVQNHFKGEVDKTDEVENYKRFGYRNVNKHYWGNHHDRWNLDKEPNEPNHVGWIVEIDPFDPNSVPVKHTSVGRFKHEGCNVHINSDGRVVAYSGDDQYYEYVYRFVSRKKYRKGAMHKAHNMTLLNEGTLSVAHFRDDSTMEWKDLIFGQGPLTEKNGFKSQADVVIEARKAADLLGATPMDRPEDVEINPKTGTVFVMLTKNSGRPANRLNPANPRPGNHHGHIIELLPPGNDHAAAVFKWDLFLLAGNPKDSTHKAKYHNDVSDDGWLACPDNCAFDNQGRLWIATDGAPKHGFADGVWVCDIRGGQKALTRHFMRTPAGAELCGPFFTPDNQNFFCAVQHPSERGSFDKPHTRWPDFKDTMPPRPSVMAIRHSKGRQIGS